MNIADQIADILQKNPKGLKASEIALEIGCTRKAVNSYLYAHKDMYDQHDGYIWTAKSAKRNAQSSHRATQTVSAESCGISIQQSSGSMFVSTLTVYKDGQGYSWTSTNNQVICCDCSRFFSIHANACPFCGCPTGHIAEYYYTKYDPKVIRQQQIDEEKRRQAEERCIKQEEEKREKKNLIDRIVTCWYGELSKEFSYRLRWNFDKTSLSALKVAAERADKIGRPKHPLSFSTDVYSEILKGSNTNFHKVLHRISQIYDKQDELSTIGDTEWNSLMSLNDNEFIEEISRLIEKHRIAQEKAAKETKRRQDETAKQKEERFNMLCGRYHISGENLLQLIEKYGSKDALLNRLQTIDGIVGEYRHKINALSYMDSLDTLKQLVEGLK